MQFEGHRPTRQAAVPLLQPHQAVASVNAVLFALWPSALLRADPGGNTVNSTLCQVEGDQQVCQSVTGVYSLTETGSRRSTARRPAAPTSVASSSPEVRSGRSPYPPAALAEARAIGGRRGAAAEAGRSMSCLPA